MYMRHDSKEKIMAATAIERIVVQTTTQEKKAISAKAKKLGLPVSELMRRGATAYKSDESDEELGVVADAAMAAANRASEAIDDVLAYVEASNKRITAMEANVGKKLRKAA
jgi:predicted RNA-binding protein (virulence factor B family)